MSGSPILLELQRLARAGLVELDPRMMIDVVRIVELVGSDDAEALAHALASRLTHDPRRWRHVADALIAAQRGTAPKPRASTARGVAPTLAPGVTTVQGKLRPTLILPKLPRRLRELSGRRWLGVLSVLSLGAVIAFPLVTREAVKAIDPELVPEAPSAGEIAARESARRAAVAKLVQEPGPPPAAQELTTSTRLDPVASATRKEVSTAEAIAVLPPGPAWFLWLLVALSPILLVLAVAWWAAPGEYRRLVEHARTRAREEREAYRAAGHVVAVPYAIERAPPFSSAHIDDAATVLGRLFRREPGRELDVAATIAATADAGGRVSPVFAPSRVREHLLVFVDLESRSHPHLEGVEWVLARWRRLGLQILRYDYHHSPESLLPERGGGRVDVDVLGHQTEGLPLLFFSRMRSAREYRGRLPWAHHLQFWPVRAWLDLDPTGLGERERDERRLVRVLEAVGLPRYPFTAAGLLAAARGLAEGFPRHRLVPEDPLPPAATQSEQLMLWAATAACVPDASWAQLDAVRRHFGGFAEVGRAPLDARAIERLLEWVAAKGYGAGLVGEGARLYFTAEGRRALARQLRAFDRARWPAPEDRTRHFEARARQWLIEQLRAADLRGDPHESALRDLRIAVHEAVLDPELARELLPGFADRSVAYEMRELVGDELAVQATGAVHGSRWSWHDAEALEGYVRGSAAVRLPADLVRVPRGRRQVAAAAALVALGAGNWGLWWWSQASEGSRERTVVVETPAAWAVVEVVGPDPLVALADVAPMRFVQVPGGTFEMGSATLERKSFAKLEDVDVSVFADERRHTVVVSAFELGATEVTNAQWKALMGKSPSDCAYGCEDEHPVQMVSWEMAARYLNQLTARENERLPPEGQRTRCYEKTDETWTWVPGCTGYRLPTEAEWEYAARAGTQTAFSFGDERRELCKHGNGADEAAGREHPDWNFYDSCDDGVVDLAGVGRYLANPWGLLDMHGNVWEWAWDWYEERYGEFDKQEGPTRDPRGPQGGDVRVLRGGSFRNEARRLRSAIRFKGEPTNGYENAGFRCARDVLVTDGKVRIYEDADFMGRWATLTIGKYRTNEFGIAPDTLSSLRVPPGLVVILNDQDDFSGEALAIWVDTASVGDRFNDRTGSIEVRRAEEALLPGQPSGVGTPFEAPAPAEAK